MTPRKHAMNQLLEDLIKVMTLERLETKGFVASRMTEPVATRGGRSRRQFTVTAPGRRAIRDAERVAKSVWAGVGASFKPRPA